MHRQALLFLLSLVAGLAAAGCAGEEPPGAATDGKLAAQGAAVVSGTSSVTLCNLPRYTTQTTMQLCGFTTPGSDGTAIASAWFSVDEGAAIDVVPGNGGFVGASTSLAEGPHAIRLYARSAAGNLAFEEKLVTVDVTPPVLQVLSPTSADVMTGTVVNVTSSVSDISAVRLQTPWGESHPVDSSTGTGTYTVDLVNRGHNTVLVRAIDAAGNATETAVRVYVCPLGDEACFASAHWTPVIASTYQSTHTVPASGGVTFRVKASDPQSSLPTYSWTANIGTLGVPVSDSTTSEVVWTPPACVPAGTSPSITATVANAVGGAASTSFSLSVTEVCPPPSVCGDGVTNGSEACDDGNTVTETFCPYGQASCTACSAGCDMALGLSGAYCGDDVKNGPEVCDDGNIISESACFYGHPTCTTCNAACTTVLSLTGAYCGDDVTNGPEACDDGNTVTESSCPYGQASCTGCNSTCTTVLNLRGGVCGDGWRHSPEACDDGNTVTESSCPYGQVSCTGCNSTCTTVLNLTGAYCGDGVKNGSEVCDDGNTVTESACPSGQESCTTCNSICTTVYHSLSVILTGAGSGSASSSPAGISCPTGKCTALFPRGTSVTLTATPTTSSAFTGWSDGGCGGTGLCVVSMTQATSVTAGFQTAELPPVTPVPGVLAAGDNHSLAVRANGSVYVWGYNNLGQLGDGTTTTRTTPIPLRVQSGQLLTGITAVSAGNNHSLALRNGIVWAWGFNSFGQLGGGNTTSRSWAGSVPGTGTTAIAAGGNFSLALRSGGTVWAWGYNAVGQLGDGTRIDRHLPIQVPGLTGITAIAAGQWHSMALHSDGTVSIWGDNRHGQLGDGTLTTQYTPIKVPGLTGIKAIAAMDFHSLALGSDGTVWAWGDNRYGQLGDGSLTNRPWPAQVPGLTRITTLAPGQWHTLALSSDGTVWAWGYNWAGQLGDGSRTDRYVPGKVPGLTGITSLAAGYLHSLALRSDGASWAWGYNGNGECGDGSTTARLTPVTSLVP